MVRDTPPPQDASTHLIWDSFLNLYKRCAPDSMQILETRSEVKVKVIVTQEWYTPSQGASTHQNLEFLAQRIVEMCTRLNANSSN